MQKMSGKKIINCEVLEHWKVDDECEIYFLGNFAQNKLKTDLNNMMI